MESPLEYKATAPTISNILCSDSLNIQDSGIHRIATTYRIRLIKLPVQLFTLPQKQLEKSYRIIQKENMATKSDRYRWYSRQPGFSRHDISGSYRSCAWLFLGLLRARSCSNFAPLPSHHITKFLTHICRLTYGTTNIIHVIPRFVHWIQKISIKANNAKRHRHGQ